MQICSHYFNTHSNVIILPLKKAYIFIFVFFLVTLHVADRGVKQLPNIFDVYDVVYRNKGRIFIKNTWNSTACICSFSLRNFSVIFYITM